MNNINCVFDVNIWSEIVYMVSVQVEDLLVFASVIALAIASFGVATHALRYPGSVISWSTLIDALYKPYWQIFGEISLDDFEGEICDTSGRQRKPIIIGNYFIYLDGIN